MVNNTCCVERQLLHANINNPKYRVNISLHWNEREVCLAKCIYSGEGALCVERWNLIKIKDEAGGEYRNYGRGEKYVQNFVEFEVLTAVVMNVATLWDIPLCSPYVNRHFGGAYHLHLQGRKSAEQKTIL
jgi:hypothetical protein